MAQTATISTYSELQTAIADELNRSDLTTVIKNWIVLCESEIKRVLRTKHKTAVTVVTTAADGEYTIGATVENYEVFRKLPENKAGPITVGSARDLYFWRQRFYGRQGYPQYATIIDTELRLAPIPDTAYTIEIIGEAIFVPLSTTPTNYVLTGYPDVYLYGSLMHSSPYLKNDARLEVWERFFYRALGQLEEAQIRNENPNTPVARLPVNLAPISSMQRR